MKIAVTYENGQVFQHFGHTEEFKIYTSVDRKIISSEIISAGEAGHEALAYFLADKGVSALICGGLGGGAYAALTDAGIIVCAGASGDADAAVEAFLAGELKDSGVNCHEHDHEAEEEHSCGSSCGGSCHGCHPQIEGKNVGKSVKVHYRGTFNDGTQFDSSYDRNEPLSFVCGAGMMIPGFDKAVANMEVGEIIDVHLMPEEAYGMPDPNAIITLDVAGIPGAESAKVGDIGWLSDQFGRPIKAKVVAVEGTNVTFDTNNEMAGKELNFKIELLDVM